MVMFVNTDGFIYFSKYIHDVAGVMVDTKSNITLHSGCADCVVCFNDDEVVFEIFNFLLQCYFQQK